MTRSTSEIDLEEYVPALVNILSSRLSSSASTTYRTLFELGVLEWRILVLLSRESGVSAQQVGAVVGQDKGPVSRGIRAMEKKGLLRVDQAERGNRHQLSITPRGEALFRASFPVAMEREERLLSGFSESERTMLREFLRRLLANIPEVAGSYEREKPAGDQD